MLHLLTEAQPKQACGDNAAAYSNQSKQKLRAQIAPVRQNAFEGEEKITATASMTYDAIG